MAGAARLVAWAKIFVIHKSYVFSRILLFVYFKFTLLNKSMSLNSTYLVKTHSIDHYLIINKNQYSPLNLFGSLGFMLQINY
jgi:hypothetical protein